MTVEPFVPPPSIGRVLSFGLKLKADMLAAKRSRVRRLCTETHADGADHYVHAVLAGRKNHLHMACDDAACAMRMME